MDLKLYRVERAGNNEGGARRKPQRMRLPRNVPYVVDNLWEWKRPGGHPCRRFSVYASPTPALARESGPKAGRLYRVEFPNGARPLIGQLSARDSKLHPDRDILPRLLVERLPDGWIDGSMEKKANAGRLWMPCLRGEEVERLFCSSPLSDCREEIWKSITYWEEVKIVPAHSDSWPYPEGEVFFEADEWILVPEV